MAIFPRNIRYTQNSIKGEFMDGKAMWDTLEDLLYGRIRVDDLPLIEVVREDGKWWALTGNRRLYLYRKLEELKVIQTIPVITVPLDNDEVQRQLMRRKTTKCEGVAIRLRGNQTAWHINQVIDRWKDSQRNNRYVNEGSRGQTTAERSGSQRGRSLNRDRSNRATPSTAFKAPLEIYPPSLRQGSIAHRSASVEWVSIRPITPGPNRSVVAGQRPNVTDRLYDGFNTNPVASLYGSIRSSSNVRTSSGWDFPCPNAPAQPDRSNSSRTGGWMSSGVSGSGQNYLEPHVITSQPRRSADPVKSSNDSCCSCCADCYCSCCCCCFPCCNQAPG